MDVAPGAAEEAAHSNTRGVPAEHAHAHTTHPHTHAHTVQYYLQNISLGKVSARLLCSTKLVVNVGHDNRTTVWASVCEIV